MSDPQLLRLGRVRAPDSKQDDLSSAEIEERALRALTQEQFQEGLLSQIRSLLWGSVLGKHWYDSVGVSLSEALSLASLVVGEQHTGDGHTVDFTLDFLASSAVSVCVYLNGLRQSFGSDYSLVASVQGAGYDTLRMSGAPMAGDVVVVDYLRVVE